MAEEDQLGLVGRHALTFVDVDDREVSVGAVGHRQEKRTS